MTWKDCGAGGVGFPAAAPKTTPDPDCTDRPWISKPAYCAWHECTFREAFPERCPYRTPDPLATLARMQNAAFPELRGSYTDPSDLALDLLNQKETCMACLERGLAHPVVRRLRRKAGLSA